jgi:hypothetical protein
MDRQPRQFISAEKAAILPEHLLEGVAISAVCDRHRINPTLFYLTNHESIPPLDPTCGILLVLFLNLIIRPGPNPGVPQVKPSALSGQLAAC